MHEPHHVVVTLGAVLIIDRLFLSMGSSALVTTQTVSSFISLAEILLAVRHDLERGKPGEIVACSGLCRMAGCAGPLERIRMNRGSLVFFSEDSVRGVTGIAVRPLVSTPSQTMAVFLFMTFAARNRTRSFHRSMGFILDSRVAVKAGEGRPVSRVFETLYVNLKGALFAPYLVTTNTILGSISLDFGDRGAP
jgi:hypothetical protein